MAFAIRNFSVLAYANGFTLWHYKVGGDDQSSVGRPGFFAPAGDMVSTGDMVLVSGAEGGRVLCLNADVTGIHAAPLG
jgi:outer membrane protein assembly factor BamB